MLICGDRNNRKLLRFQVEMISAFILFCDFHCNFIILLESVCVYILKEIPDSMIQEYGKRYNNNNNNRIGNKSTFVSTYSISRLVYIYTAC